MTARELREWADWLLSVEAQHMKDFGRFEYGNTTAYGYPWGVQDGTPGERALYAYFIAEYLESEK